VPTLALNGSVCHQYPRVCQAAHAAGWEFMGHGFVQMPMHSLEDQRGAIRRTVEAITAFTGRKPRGWESPGLTETLDTADLLAAEGIEYVADGCSTISRARSRLNSARSYRCRTPSK
jgi:peptidoglycan/xylan/chitin deacetylase (PgdA/CDA1 family)